MEMGWTFLGMLTAVAAVLCAVGFYKYVYFVSIGYGFAVAGIGVGLMVLLGERMQLVNYLQCVLLIAYGVRLSGFLLYREIRSVAYRKTLTTLTQDEKTMSLLMKIGIWLSVSILYVAQTSPVFYGIYNGTTHQRLPWMGCVIGLIALIIEACADKQKSEQKATCPNMVATKGLYKIVRCPNYFGEILFWTGIYMSGLSALNHWGQWIMATVAYILILMIMFNGARRLEKRQLERYGRLLQYRKYADQTPIIIPFVPLYHLVSVKKVKR